MRVRALQMCYVNECTHAVGEVFDINDSDFAEGVMEEVGADIPLTRNTPPPQVRVQPAPPISGGRELGAESDNLIPEEGMDMETHREGGKRKR